MFDYGAAFFYDFISELCDRVFFHFLHSILLFLSAKAVYDAFTEMKKKKKKC